MRVITLDEAGVNYCCLRLFNDIQQSGFTPELILGIKSGGKPISEILYKSYPKGKISLNFCESQTSYTYKKKVILKHYLKYLPKPLLDLLRIIEATLFFNKNQRKKIMNFILPTDLKSYNKILIVDDAIDTGTTIKAVKDQIIRLNPNCEIKSAVITVTSPKSIIKPDFTIYNEKTLVRFPWSIDSK